MATAPESASAPSRNALPITQASSRLKRSNCSAASSLASSSRVGSVMRLNLPCECGDSRARGSFCGINGRLPNRQFPLATFVSPDFRGPAMNGLAGEACLSDRGQCFLAHQDHIVSAPGSGVFNRSVQRGVVDHPRPQVGYGVGLPCNLVEWIVDDSVVGEGITESS